MRRKIQIYNEVLSKCMWLERKGKTMPYTSANGHMFSFFNKAGKIGFHFSKEVQKKYIEEFDTTLYSSYNATMKGYVLIPERMLSDLDNQAKYFDESYDYAMSLDTK